MIRIALLLWAALLLAMPATAQTIVAPPSGFIVAATQGQTSVTGTTSETNLAALKIPAGSMGKNGHVEVKCLWSYTNSANNKILAIRVGTTAGAIVGPVAGSATTVTTTATAQTLTIIRSNNATNAQTIYSFPPTTPFGSSILANTATALDVTADFYLNINGQLALSTETLTLVHAYAVVYPSNDAAPPDFDISFMQAPLDSRLTFTRASTATYFDATGTMQTAASGVPRFDYDPVAHTTRGLLIEEARTNQALNSSNASAWPISGGGSWTSPAAALDGTATAYLFQEDTSNANHFFAPGIAITNATQYAFSFFAKAGPGGPRYVYMNGLGLTAAGLNPVWDVANGADITTGSAASFVHGITRYPNGWYRCWIVFTTTSTSGIGLYLTNTQLLTTYQGDGVSGMYFWGWQLEAGASWSSPTSYIPSGASATTRSADTVTMTYPARVSAGTIAPDIMVPYVSAIQTNAAIVGLDTGSGSDTIELRQQGGTTNYGATSFTASINRGSNIDGALSAYMVYKLGTTYDYPSLVLTSLLNGGTAASATTTGLPATLSRFTIGYGRNAQLNGWIRRLRYWPRALPVTELQAVTQ